jgi:type VI secretion system protein VasJ
VSILPALDLEKLFAPIDARQPAGAFDAEDETFQGVDHEMVKFGGLRESELSWSYIDEASQSYLSKQCKHFRIVGHLVTARVHTRSWQGWAESVALLAGMVERYWETGHPKPGPTGYPAKRRMVEVLLERFGDALKKLSPDKTAKTYQEAGRQALDRLHKSAVAAQLDIPMLTHLESQIIRIIEESNKSDAAASSVPGLSLRKEAPLTEAYFASDQTLNLGNERESKRSLLAVAEFINNQNAYDSTGYLLRRFALWSHLTSAPNVRKDQRTELMCVPVDVVENYQEALAGNHVNPVLLQRIEKSVTSSPYWILGSFLSASVANRLEMPEVSSAIRLATERFVLRIPALRTLQFSDGRAFVDNETLAWLSGADGAANQAADAREYASLRNDLTASLENNGVELFLRQLEKLQSEADDPRHCCHVMTIAADLLAGRGFFWLSSRLYHNAYDLMEGSTASTWEPALYGYLTKQMKHFPGI